MKTANEFKELRDKKYNDWINFDKKVKGQWSLLETIVNRGFNSLGHSQKYIDITNVGELYKENEKKLISEPNCFYITKDKNGTRLYFDEKDYNHYVNSNKVKTCGDKLKELDFNIDTSNKNEIKNNFNKQEKDNNKVEAKEYDTFEELATDIWNNIFNKYNL